MSKKLECPYCKAINTITDEEYKDIDFVGKVVVECNKCNKLYTLRDDGDGEYISGPK